MIGVMWLLLWGCVVAAVGLAWALRIKRGFPLANFIESVKNVDTIVVATDESGVVTYFNPAAERALGYRAKDVVGKLRKSSFCVDFGVSAESPTKRERTFICRDGTTLTALVTCGTIHTPHGKPVGHFEVGIDIGDLKEKEEVLLEKQALVESIALTSPTIFYVFDLAERKITYTNRKLGTLLGYTDEQMEDMGTDPLPAVMHPEDLDILFNRYQSCTQLADGEVLEIEFRCLTADGELRWLQARDVVFKRDANNRPAQILVSVVDATERKLLDEQIENQVMEIQDTNLALEIQTNALEEANKQLEALAFTDGLTGIANHRSFQEALATNFDVCKRRKRKLSLMLIDVDRFKQYNDNYGHPSGDIVLKRVASVLRETCPVGCIPARYGGEEFAVICPGFSAEEVLDLAEDIREAIESTPWPERGVTVSIGAVSMAAHITSPSELVSASDNALYSSKASGRNCVTYYAQKPPAMQI